MAEPMDCSLVVAIRPGTGSPAATRSCAKPIIVFRSLVMSTRFVAAAQARTARSGVPSGKASCAHQVDFRHLTTKAADDLAMDIRVTRQPEHGRSPERGGVPVIPLATCAALALNCCPQGVGLVSASL